MGTKLNANTDVRVHVEFSLGVSPINSIAAHSKYNNVRHRLRPYRIYLHLRANIQCFKFNLIEKTEDVSALRTHFDWSTIGNLANLFELARKFGRKNAISEGDRFNFWV